MNHEKMPFQKKGLHHRVPVVTVGSTSTGPEPSLLLTGNNFLTYAKIQGLHQVNKFRVLAENGDLSIEIIQLESMITDPRMQFN
jgi:hypothetical protein